MKSSSCTRRLRAMAPEGRSVPPEIFPKTSIDNTSADNVITCHCHCPSSRGSFEDTRFPDRSTSTSSKRTISCDVCWRLHVRRFAQERLHGQDATSHFQNRSSARGPVQNSLEGPCSVQERLGGYFDVQERPRGSPDVHERRNGRCSVPNKRCGLQERSSESHQDRSIKSRDTQERLSEDRGGSRDAQICASARRDFPGHRGAAGGIQERVSSHRDVHGRPNVRRCVQEEVIAGRDVVKRQNARCDEQGTRCRVNERLKTKSHAQDHLGEAVEARERLNASDDIREDVNKQRDAQERRNDPRDRHERLCADYESQKDVKSRCSVQADRNLRCDRLSSIIDVQEEANIRCHVHERLGANFDVQKNLDDQQNSNSRCNVREDRSTHCDRLNQNFDLQQDSCVRCNVREDPSIQCSRLNPNFKIQEDSYVQSCIREDPNTHHDRLNPNLDIQEGLSVRCHVREDSNTHCDRLSPNFDDRENSNAQCDARDRPEESMDDSSGNRGSQTRSRWCDPRKGVTRLSRTLVGPHRGGTSSRCASSVVRWNSRGGHQLAWCTSLCRRFAWTIAFLIFLAPPALAGVQGNTTNNIYKQNGVCQSVDIRNNVTQFSKLEGCRVVQGFVQILLIDNSKPSDFADISFPELLEITGYLMLYRVDGLRSVGRLFPNLAVIRGHSLFINYALVAFEMTNLHEIGLYSLTDILRGSVRFEKNPLLCYADTIDWDIIAKAGKGEHIIMGNNPRNNCPVCQKSCPTRLIKPDKTLCWNQEHCQRICDPKCEDNACDATGKQCCHPMCLGGCNGTEAHQCTRCRNVMLPGNPPECKKRCPNGTYEYQNYWCVTAEECRQMKKPLLEAHDVKKHYFYKPFNGSCVLECPAGYTDENVDGKASCRKCKGPCLKECAGSNVDNIASAQTLRGCTRITGSLEIQIRGGKNIVKELEDNLSAIEEIDGYLKVVRSFPLISLNFLKNLRVIRGLQLDNGKYSLVVLDNQNLQELWEWDTHPAISIYSDQAPGKVFFHFNPKLCLYKIETLREKAGLQPFTDLEVAPNSNGDKVACNVTELKTWTYRMWPMAAVIEWEVFEHYDTRSLLGYVVYFIEAPNRNVTMYDGRDACGGDGWRVEDVTMAATNASSNSTQAGPPYVVHILTQLKPYTQYAYYVKTYTIATERSGGQSNMTYFTTKPDAPSAPRGLITWSNSSSELVMHWQPPLQKNGNLTHYRIVGREETDEPDFIYKRNYCLEPLVLLPEKEKGVMSPEDEKKAEAESDMTKVSEKGTCNCADREADQSMREKEVSSSIAFEDALHNRVYVKRINVRRRRDVNEMSIELDQESLESEDGDSSHDYEKNNTHARNDTSEILVPSTDTMYVMRNLRHFTAYKIEIEACRAREVDDTAKTCSTKSIKTQRTLSLESADEIPPASFKLSKSGENNSIVTLFWEEPPQPNGLIVAYQIEYKREDIENIKADVVCITRRKFTDDHNSYVLKGLTAGRYSVMVRATSMAGNGNYTEKKFFSIEEYENNTFWTFFWTILGIVLVLVFLLGVYVYKRKTTQRIPNTLITTVNPEYVPAVYVPDEWEVPRENIVVGEPLGNGSFGMVYEGIAVDVVKGKPEVKCAVKTVNSTATDRERVEFLNEASVMKAFNTHHVVRLLGVVSKVQPTLVVMELMVNGDLKTYLRSHRPDTCENFTKEPPTLKRILQMAIEIADGMAYLAAKKFVHRDLAARNCMVAEDLTVKVGDFGMTRDVYETDYYRKGTKGLLPVRWMAPESLKDGVFTSFSDVWSYGVVLWEMVTLASQPYQGLSNDQVLRYVIDGGVMERPENCPDSLYNLMRRTWSHKATKRPTFIDMEAMLLPEIDSKAFERVSFYHSPEGIEARNQNNSHSQPADMDLELMTLQDLREEEAEAEEDSPLRQDFGDFANFEPTSIKNSLSPRYGIDLYGENSKATLNCHDMNSSKVPLKAGFDDFDGVSAESLTSSKDTLNLPFVEDSLKSVKNSPFISRKCASRGNVSQASVGKSVCPQSLGKRSFLDSPNRANHDYKNRSPEMVIGREEKKTTVPLHVDFPSIDAIDVDVEKRDATSTAEYANTPETLNNGYIGRTAT